MNIKITAFLSDDGEIKRKDSLLKKKSAVKFKGLRMYSISHHNLVALCHTLRKKWFLTGSAENLSFQKRLDLEASGTSQRVYSVELVDSKIISTGWWKDEKEMMERRNKMVFRLTSYVHQLWWLYIIPTNLHPLPDKGFLMGSSGKWSNLSFLIDFYWKASLIRKCLQGFLNMNQPKSLNGVPCGFFWSVVGF